jgi:hypothetical protein
VRRRIDKGPPLIRRMLKFFHQPTDIVVVYKITIHRKVASNVRLTLPIKWQSHTLF